MRTHKFLFVVLTFHFSLISQKKKQLGCRLCVPRLFLPSRHPSHAPPLPPHLNLVPGLELVQFLDGNDSDRALGHCPRVRARGIQLLPAPQ